VEALFTVHGYCTPSSTLRGKFINAKWRGDYKVQIASRISYSLCQRGSFQILTSMFLRFLGLVTLKVWHLNDERSLKVFKSFLLKSWFMCLPPVKQGLWQLHEHAREVSIEFLPGVLLIKTSICSQQTLKLRTPLLTSFCHKVCQYDTLVLGMNWFFPSSLAINWPPYFL